jgi:hypothetical protein
MGPLPGTGSIDSMLCFHVDRGQVCLAKPETFGLVRTSAICAFDQAMSDDTCRIEGRFGSIHHYPVCCQVLTKLRQNHHFSERAKYKEPRSVKKSAPTAMRSALSLKPPPDHISYFERPLAIDRRWPGAKINHRAAVLIAM